MKPDTIESLAMTWRHDFGLLTPEKRAEVLEQVRPLWEHHCLPAITEAARLREVVDQLHRAERVTGLRIEVGEKNLRKVTVTGPSRLEHDMALAVAGLYGLSIWEIMRAREDIDDLVRRADCIIANLMDFARQYAPRVGDDDPIPDVVGGENIGDWIDDSRPAVLRAVERLESKQ